MPSASRTGLEAIPSTEPALRPLNRFYQMRYRSRQPSHRFRTAGRVPHTDVAIIGGGPSGLLLSHMLDRSGVRSIVLERTSRARVLQRIRAGVLEPGTVELLRRVGLGERMDREGEPHDGTTIRWAGRGKFIINTKQYTGKQMMVYGQTSITQDLYAARDAAGGTIIDDASDVELCDVTTDHPYVTFRVNGTQERLDCTYIAGCDGFHGVSRAAIPSSVLRTYERAYPFAWLGIMSETPPYSEICYVSHSRGFALASKRNEMLSRYYIQCDLQANVNQWSDDRFWQEFKARCPDDMADAIVTGPSIEKSIAPLRSFVAEPMRYGRLFLVGDAAHIVPPTGAKGLNLAISDAFYLHRALARVFESGRTDELDRYSEVALRRVWSAERFSWQLTTLLHRFPTDTPFDERVKEDELNLWASSPHAQASIAEQYAGLPFEPLRSDES